MGFIRIGIEQIQVDIGMYPIIDLIVIVRADIETFVVFCFDKRFRIVIIEAEVCFQFFRTSGERERMSLVMCAAFQSQVHKVGICIAVRIFGSQLSVIVDYIFRIKRMER